MMRRNLFLVVCMALAASIAGFRADAQNLRADGYQGIWFTLGQFSKYGDKYSGGLGTYTSNHRPLAIYSPEARKTFFVYGGTSGPDKKHLLIMISYYDHISGKVPRPVVVYDKQGVNDPHDNASISIDDAGFIYVFISGRARTRPGHILKSTRPLDIGEFEMLGTYEMTYPQPRFIKGFGFINLFTKYTGGRELYWNSSTDGKNWSPATKIAGMGGHYQVSSISGNRIATVFNYHPGGNVDKRTNLYLIMTDDMGKTWKTVDGKELVTPLTDPHCEALVWDYESERKLVYINDLNFDAQGNPVILAVISNDYRPGPEGDPREWTIIYRKDNKWNFTKVCQSTHNYDMGSLYIEDDKWKIVGPTEPGPQKYGAGGEIATWISSDNGATWTKTGQLTENSTRNHSYARRPMNAEKDFYSFWADGDADKFSESHLYFSNRKGDKVWELPYRMDREYMKPVLVSRRNDRRPKTEDRAER